MWSHSIETTPFRRILTAYCDLCFDFWLNWIYSISRTHAQVTRGRADRAWPVLYCGWAFQVDAAEFREVDWARVPAAPPAGVVCTCQTAAVAGGSGATPGSELRVEVAGRGRRCSCGAGAKLARVSSTSSRARVGWSPRREISLPGPTRRAGIRRITSG